MRQHIDAVRLEELTPKGKEKLREWWKPIYGDVFICPLVSPKAEIYPGEGYVDKVLEDSRTLPLLSIGQMIEFLFDNKAFIFANDTEGAYLNKAQNIVLYWENQKIELCDALWEAVKEEING